MGWSREDVFIELRVRRSLALAILVSILLHLGALFFVIKHILDVSSGASANQRPGIAVRLATQKPAPAPPPPPSVAEPQEEPKPAVQQSRPLTRPRTVITVQRNSPQSVAPVAPAPTPPQTTQPQTPPVDMMAMVSAARQRRQEQDQSAAAENAAAEAANAQPSADQVAQANLQRNLEKLARAGKGESGIFQIRSMGVRTAQFSFRGWTTDETNSTLQIIDVDAGPGGNVQLAVVNRMIQLIRTHYQGDFNFDSHRLGRVVVQSARLEDTAKLQSFLMLEFFGG
ncbi:MAG: hypothetical protein ABSF50_12880 [Burkholderiaceae bacterium]